MIRCPKCNNTLPASYQQCQFCGADVSQVPRPVAPAAPKYRGYQPEKWVVIAYNAISIYYVVIGIVNLVLFSGILGHTVALLAVVGGVNVLMGVGLLLKIDLIRGIMNVLCWLQIGFGLLGLWFDIMAAAFLGIIGFLMVVLTVINIAAAGLMVYLIAETDVIANI